MAENGCKYKLIISNNSSGSDRLCMEN